MIEMRIQIFNNACD